jgi:outer membrane protein TolC
MLVKQFIRSGTSVALFAVVSSCAAPAVRPRVAHLSVAPSTQPTATLEVDVSQIQPMYRELLAIDLPTVAHVAAARNLDVQAARQRVEASQGRYETSVEAIFPVIAPALTYQHLNGVNQQSNGTLVHTNFNTFLPALAVQWILNPGKVAYDVIASKRRLEASEAQQDAALLETTRQAAVQYYEMVLAQQRLAVAQQAVSEAEEFLRISQLRLRAGNGLPADELRARAALAGRQQDLALAVNAFYQASLALTVTLHLEPSVTLVPRAGQVNQTTLVREDLGIDALLATAVRYRPDLEAARGLLAAAEADRGSVVWGGVGPQVQAGYSYGGIGGSALGDSFSLHQQDKASVSAGFAFGLSTFGQVKSASAAQALASLDVQRQLDTIRAAVIAAQQTSLTSAKLIPMARQQVDAAQEALRLAQANLRAGTMLAVDVLQAQDAVDQARLRYVDAVVHYNQAQVNLLAALGILDAKALGGASTQNQR